MGRIKSSDLFQFLHDYLRVYLPDQRCASPHTIKAYRETLNQFMDYLVNTTDVSLEKVTFDCFSYDEVSSYLDWLVSEKNCSVSTRNHRLAVIRSFMSYAVSRNSEYMIYKNALSGIPISKSPVFSGIEYMSENAVRALLAQPDSHTRKGLRDQFLMILMYDSAARIQEILNLKVCDIRCGTTPTATLLGKGSKVRTVPLMPETIAHFRNYRNAYHADEDEHSTQPLFYVIRHHERILMSPDNVNKFMRKYGEKARVVCREVPPNVHPHLLRHSRAMHLYQHGMDLTLISQWLGHANLETSLIYAHADTEQKRKAIEKAVGRKVVKGTGTSRYTISDEETLKRLYGLI